MDQTTSTIMAAAARTTTITIETTETTIIKTKGMMIHGTTTINQIEDYCSSNGAVGGRSQLQPENVAINRSSLIGTGPNTKQGLHHLTSSWSPISTRRTGGGERTNQSARLQLQPLKYATSNLSLGNMYTKWYRSIWKMINTATCQKPNQTAVSEWS